jgi:hypothetical protein
MAAVIAITPPLDVVREIPRQTPRAKLAGGEVDTSRHPRDRSSRMSSRLFQRRRGGDCIVHYQQKMRNGHRNRRNPVA